MTSVVTHLYSHYQQLRRRWLMRPRLLQSTLREPLKLPPPDVWLGDSYRGQVLMQGSFCFYNEEMPTNSVNIWNISGISDEFKIKLHTFEWLRDLRQLGDNETRLLARTLIDDWMRRVSKEDQIVWRFDIVGQRLAIWLGMYDFYAASADQSFQARLQNSIRQQCDYLYISLGQEEDPLKRLMGLKGLILAILALPGYSRRLFKVLPQLQLLLDEQLMKDGTHVSRTPSLQFFVLRDLIDIRAALHHFNYGEFSYIQSYIEIMAPVLRVYRHGDGGIAHFNLTQHVAAESLDNALSYADTGSSPTSLVNRGGIERVSAQKTLVLFNVGCRDKPLVDDSILSCEVSIGRQRMVVNSAAIMGGYRRFVSEGTQHKYLSNIDIPMLAHRAVHCDVSRQIQEKGHFLLTGQRTWQGEGGIIQHERQIYIHSNGEDIRGKDTVRITLKPGYEFASFPLKLQFIIHPEVNIMRTLTPTVWELNVPKYGIWHFYGDNQFDWCLEPAIYMEKSFVDTVALTLNIVSVASGLSEWRWAFKKQ